MPINWRRGFGTLSLAAAAVFGITSFIAFAPGDSHTPWRWSSLFATLWICGSFWIMGKQVNGNASLLLHFLTILCLAIGLTISSQEPATGIPTQSLIVKYALDGWFVTMCLNWFIDLLLCVFARRWWVRKV